MKSVSNVFSILNPIKYFGFFLSHYSTLLFYSCQAVTEKYATMNPFTLKALGDIDAHV